MTTFDGSTGGGFTAESATELKPVLAPGELDTLTLLRERVREKQAEEFPNHILDAGGIRLSCRTVIDFIELQQWRERAIPKAWRNKKLSEEQRASKMDMRQFFTSLLSVCTEEVEVLGRDGQTWTTVTDVNGRVLTFANGELNSVFGVMDTISMFRVLYKRDADLLHAGNELLSAAGWTEEQITTLHEGGELPDPQ